MMVQCRESDETKRADLRERLYGLIREEFGIDCLIELVGSAQGVSETGCR